LAAEGFLAGGAEDFLADGAGDFLADEAPFLPEEAA